MVVLSTVSPPTDGIRLRQPRTTVYVNNDDLGEGTLYIAESLLSWISHSGSGFSIEYPRISLHAICRDVTAFPHPCLFLMLDIGKEDDEGIANSDDDDDNDDNDHECDEQGSVELRLVPNDKGMLDAMFFAMNACQALHPDPHDSSSEEDFIDHDDLEFPVDETDCLLANLRIGARDVHRMVGGMQAWRGECSLPYSAQDWVGMDYRAEDRMVVGVAEDREADRVVGMVHRAQDDRSFFQENRLHQNRMENLQPQSHMDLLDNFDDEEN